MNVLVCVKAVPASFLDVRISETQDTVEAGGSSLVLDESDEYALQQALNLRSEFGGAVTVLTAGPLSVLPVLQFAMARGADRAIRVDSNSSHPENSAPLLAAAIKKSAHDVILAGVESTDHMAGYVAISVAQRIGLPFASGIVQLEFDSSRRSVRVCKELGGGVQELLEIELPCLLCIQPGIFELPYVPASKRLAARSKAVTTLTPEELGIAENRSMPAAERGKITAILPPGSRQVKWVEGNPTEIARKLVKKIREAPQ